MGKHFVHDCRQLLIVALLAALGCVSYSSNAQAGGFGVARFGGGVGTVVDANPTSLYYNPAAMAFSLKGTEVFLDGSYAFRTATYTRTAADVDPYTGGDPFGPGGVKESDRELAERANTGKSTLSNRILLPMAGVTSDFGSGLPFRLGAAFFIPFGGSAVWDRAENEKELNNTFPGSGDGPVRWFSIDGTIQSLAAAFGGAYKFDPIGLSVGLTGNLYISKIETLRARNLDGTDHLVDSNGKLKEGRSSLKAKSLDFGMGIGLMYEPIPNVLAIGFSYQSMPNFTGRMLYKGELKNLLATATASEPTPIYMTATLPDVIRLGAKYQVTPTIELKTELDWTRWSEMDTQCVFTRKEGDEASNETIDRICATNEDGSAKNPQHKDDPSVLQVIQRHWKDTFKVRFDATWQVLPWLAPSIGVAYDSNAIPDASLDPALMDMHKMTFSLGSNFQILDWLGFGLSLTDVLYLERDTSGKSENPRYKGASRQPGSGGIYTQNTFIINSNLHLGF